MKIFCAELNRKNDKLTAKAVVMLKKRSGLVLLKNYTTDADNLQPLSAEMPLNIAIDDYDVIEETLHLPPVKDLRTFRVIAHNKLKDNLEQGIEYLMSYKENDMGDADDSGNHEYRVFLSKRSLLDEDSGLSEKQKKNLNVFTVTDFALSGIVKRYYPDKMVFHAYSDEDKVCVTVCRNDVILYTRTNEIGKETGPDLLSIYYENINLTYMYVTKNLRLDVDIIVLSGDLADNYELSKMVNDFTSAPQTVLLPAGHVGNCNYKVFQKFMIPISLNFINSSYDFTPIEYKVEQGSNFLTAIASIVTLMLIVMMFFMNATALENFFSERENLSNQSKILQLRLRQYTKSFDDTQLRKFGFYYYGQEKERLKSPLYIYKDASKLLELANYENILFDSDRKGNVLAISGELDFENLKSIDAFKQKIESEIASMNNLKKYTVNDNSRYDMDNLKVDVKIKIEQVADVSK
jgi:hypothetical protein